MKGLKQVSLYGLGGLILSVLGLGLFSEGAMAQAAYGSYVGVGGSVGLQEGGGASGVVAIRYRLLEVPISLRTQVLAGNGIAVVPTISYDIPINWETDAYIGAGVAFTGNEDTPVGTPPVLFCNRVLTAPFLTVTWWSLAMRLLPLMLMKIVIAPGFPFKGASGFNFRDIFVKIASD